MSRNERQGEGRQQPVRLRILDKEVQLGCQPGEEEELMQAAAYVEQSMRELRQRNMTSSIEKLAIVTAINTASELLRLRAAEGEQSEEAAAAEKAIEERLNKLTERLDAVLQDESEST